MILVAIINTGLKMGIITCQTERQQLINKWLKFKHLLFPQSCLLCTASDGGTLALCSDCIADLSWSSRASCPQCALSSPGSETCGHCLISPPAFDATHALFRYAFPMDSLLQA